MDGGEAIRASDEDFASWSDGWHAPCLFGLRVRVRYGDLEDGSGEGTLDKVGDVQIRRMTPAV